MLSTNSITAGKSLIKNMRLYFKLFFKYVFFYFLIIYSIKAGDVIEKLEEIEKKLENNEIIKTNLKNKQNKIDLSIKKIENLLKKNKNKIKIQFSKKQKKQLEINNYVRNRESLEQNLVLLNTIKKNVIEAFLKDSFVDNKNLELDNLLVNIYNNIDKKIYLNKTELRQINDFLIISEEELKKIELKLADINSNFLEKSDLETSLQGENIITMIQRKEKELESAAIGKKALELKKLIESLKKNSQKPRKNKNKKNYNLTKIEDILPIKLKNIQKMRTDRAKKGIFLTLKKKSFLTAPHDGLVVYSDSFKGYGNMVILDLGNNYHIIYSGLTSIMCSVGDWVNAGNILGEIELKYKKNEVYLEVRFKGKTVNPAGWIKS